MSVAIWLQAMHRILYEASDQNGQIRRYPLPSLKDSVWLSKLFGYSLINEKYGFGSNKMYLGIHIFHISLLGNECFLMLLWKAFKGIDLLTVAVKGKFGTMGKKMKLLIRDYYTVPVIRTSIWATLNVNTKFWWRDQIIY